MNINHADSVLNFKFGEFSVNLLPCYLQPTEIRLVSVG